MVRRSQWLTFRPTLSNWISDTESEAREKVSLSRSTETFSPSPLLVGDQFDTVGLACFGLTPVVLSGLPLSAFLDTAVVRDHWLNKRSSHSNWTTRRMNEERIKVSLEEQPGSLSQNPLVFDGLVDTIGLIPFGGGLVNVSKLLKSLYETAEDLFDTLATEDLDPIITESDGDEILLG